MYPDRNLTSAQENYYSGKLITFMFIDLTDPFIQSDSQEDQKQFFKEQTIFVVYTARFIWQLILETS